MTDSIRHHKIMIELGGMLVIAAIGFALSVIKGLIDSWGTRELPQSVQAEMSPTDEKMIAQTQELIRTCFGENVTERLRNASNLERINLMSDFAAQVVQLYGLDIDVDVVIQEANNHGAYSWKDQKAAFNIVLLTVDANSSNFEACVREVFDTILHELRHAVQHKALMNQGFWDVSEERCISWANNITNYIKPSTDFRAYVNQPIEADAATFAGRILEGVN